MIGQVCDRAACDRVGQFRISRSRSVGRRFRDEALDFYVGKLGFEVHTDQDLGFMRWLTVAVPGQPGRELLLERPGAPAHDEGTAEQVRDLVIKAPAAAGSG